LEEIAQVMGKEVNAVKVQLHRARARLREKMQTYFRADVSDLR
jgi:RNA polymerase sigma-70 factor (ECF subfamily)